MLSTILKLCFIFSQISKFEKLLKKSFPKYIFSPLDIHTAFNFVNFILEERPEERPDAARVKNHPFLLKFSSSFAEDLNYSPQRYSPGASNSIQMADAQDEGRTPSSEAETICEAGESLLEVEAQCENRVSSANNEDVNGNGIALQEAEMMCEVENDFDELFVIESMYVLFPLLFFFYYYFVNTFQQI